MKLFKRFLGFVIAIVIVAIAFIIGIEAGKYYQKQKLISQRNANRESILSQMHDLKIGKSLPNYSFEDLSFQPVKLQSLVKQKTILMFIEPDCPSCIEDIERLSKNFQTEYINSHIIIISDGNPRQLMDLRDEYNLRMPILYDHNSRYTSIFGIFTYPFHIVTNKNLVVCNIITGQLVEEDIPKIFN